MEIAKFITKRLLNGLLVMEFSPKKVQAVVLVDRQHKLFPVSPDFVGLSLSTTLQEHIVVEFDSKGAGAAYLT